MSTLRCPRATSATGTASTSTTTSAPLLLAQPRALSLTLRRGRSYTDPDEMRINRDRSHPNRVDTFLKYYDDNTDGSIHKHEFDAKHNEL